MKFNYEYLGTPSGILKLLEMMFVVIAFGVFRGVFNGNGVDFGGIDANYFGGGVLVACLIITPLLLICYLMGKTEIQESILEVSLNFLFFVFLFSVSIRAFVYWGEVSKGIKGRSAGLSLGSFTFFASLSYMADIFFSAKNLRDAYYGN